MVGVTAPLYEQGQAVIARGCDPEIPVSSYFFCFKKKVILSVITKVKLNKVQFLKMYQLHIKKLVSTILFN